MKKATVKKFSITEQLKDITSMLQEKISKEFVEKNLFEEAMNFKDDDLKIFLTKKESLLDYFIFLKLSRGEIVSTELQKMIIDKYADEVQDYKESLPF